MTKEELAYIAGFLDGDGCVMLQLIYRHDYLLGYQIRASIVFYQKQQNRQFLEWLKDKLVDGYIRNRNDGMSEYTIVGINAVTKLLLQLEPYLRLKKEQTAIALKVMAQMPSNARAMQPEVLLSLAREVDKFADMNYSKRRANTSVVLENFLRSRNLLDPVETDP